MCKINRENLKRQLEELLPLDEYLTPPNNKRVDVILNLIWENGGRWED